MAGLYSLGTSLTAASNGPPQGLFAPRSIALADPRRVLANAWAPRLAATSTYSKGSLTGGCDASCLRHALSFSQDGKAARLKLPAPNSVAQEKVVVVASAAAAGDRFDGVVARAGLSPQKLAAAFTRAENAPFLLASLPAANRFGGAAETGHAEAQTGPAEARFGASEVDVRRASDLALALANVMPEETADVPTSVALAATDAPDLAAGASDDASGQAEVQVASLPPQDDLPDSIDVPGLRPRTTLDRSAAAPAAAAKPDSAKPKTAKAKPQPDAVDTADAPRGPASLRSSASPRSSEQIALPGVPGSKPAKRSKAQAAEVLAYAKPDMPERGAGGIFGNLFTSRPSMGNGVAVYDISAKTVYMPDGSKLEAHSGLGSMVDQPRFVDKKNVGPTPPDTYNLSLRESRFHGVEAIRLTPASGNNKYGRNGLLAHTYMLRGGRAESNGCVVFRDYARFLAAYKRGKIKRLVVVPRLSKPLTRVAQEGREG